MAGPGKAALDLIGIQLVVLALLSRRYESLSEADKAAPRRSKQGMKEEVKFENALALG
jgi:hypothetical protein